MRTAIVALSAAGATAISLLALAPAGAAEVRGSGFNVPDFSGTWQRNDQPYMQFLPPESGQGPVREHPVQKRHPTEGDNRPFIADPTDPLLKPWAAAVLKDKAYRQIVNQEEILPAHSLCWPAGVPGNLRLREPLQILQEPKQVTFIYQRDHQVRRIYLDEQHSANPKISWYGESVGRYEGDTLVVDTVGLDARSMVDWYGTPHTEKIHVVERYRMIDGGQRMEVTFTVTDPDTFTRPWTAKVHYRRGAAQIEEIVCAENNKNASTNEYYPVPMAAKADF
jgi:hypothetical protein